VFEKNIEEMGLVKRSAEFIRVNDRTLQGLPNSREIVRWAYKSEMGAVSPVFEVEDRYIVATVVKITEKGTKPFEEVKEEIEALVKRDKKAEKLIAKAEKALGAAKGNLDVFAQQAEGMVQVFTGATFQSNFLTGIGREPIINGTLFALGKGKLSKPLKGERGVYVVVVDELTTAPKDADLNPSKQALANQLAARGSNEAFNAKKEMIEINDNRHLFY
jgi:peptidyl-prolyl cis-trans isomerase D